MRKRKKHIRYNAEAEKLAPSSCFDLIANKASRKLSSSSCK